MLFSRKKVSVVKYDKENNQPIIRQSICTGEMVGGLKDRKTGKFKEIMLIRSEGELEEFKKMYGVSDVEKEY